jgi:hypothetical protein
MSSPLTPCCKCGQVAIPNGWNGVETSGRVHYFDRCADVFVYDEVREIDPKVLAMLKRSGL